MNILTLNFSPKGEKSVTYQYYLFAKQYFKKDTDQIEDLMIGKEFSIFRTDALYKKSVCEKIQRADIIYVISPVYAYLLPGQFYDFYNSVEDSAFVGKNVFAIISSAKVHDDITIQDFYNFCHEKKVGQYNIISLDMDLNDEKKVKKEICSFISYNNFLLTPEIMNSNDEKIVVLTDNDDNNDIISTVFNTLGKNIPVVNIVNRRINYCRGDLSCMLDKCIYHNDDFEEIFDFLLNSSIIIFSFSGSSFSGILRSFFSRALSVGQHHESLPDKQMIFINRENSNLINDWIKSYAEMQSSHLVGIINKNTTIFEINSIVQKALWSSKNNFIPPCTYLKKGAYSIFREVVNTSGYVMPHDIDHLTKQGVNTLRIKLFKFINFFLVLKPIRKRLIKVIPDIMMKKQKKLWW
ncbi:MAG: hypothetical protein A2015_11355 [Spirochaetes bacterium GWF1_31_7]|nr:MAG: hypothetical protein A2Y30_15720 [Spirochaetes bacterium GWE1_32_154]OHD49019.1 MAG: hypothetical protein A2015_11355 [Spirochaetes bacterium GWF1_31_7]OHD50396.1 MAG: hypothetical protein A2Y29_13770 [Spirochaetes bacterium GWE2_31_10]OHD73923.1 MAG: hypothetical protein A2355_07200 [Spirochaetes bacterium RIFOXYB1_FULL_32_8]HBD93814.1 hypothetical protein [Spirochaetia bacterium]